MRNPAAAIRRVPGAAAVGRRIAAALDFYLDRYPILEGPADSILSGQTAEPFTEDLVLHIRRGILALLGAASDIPSATSPQPATAGAERGLQPDIIEAYNTAAGDPDRALVTWLRTGAPIGILNPIDDCGIFPSVNAQPPGGEDISAIANLGDGEWTNHGSAENNQEAVLGLIRKAQEAGFLRIFTSLADLCTAAGSWDVTLSPLGLISKVRADGTQKHRIIWDLLKSRVNTVVRQGERIVLPRIADVINDAVHLGRRWGASSVTWLVIDVSDAFSNIRVRPNEKRFTTARVGPVWILCDTLVFGSGSSPTVWGRFAAWLGRSGAAILGRDSAGRLQIFVDDPILTLAGPSKGKRRLATRFLLWAAVCGYPLAWAKAAGGPKVVWIGASYSILNDSIAITIPPGKIEELLGELDSVLSGHVVTVRRLRALCGKISFFAGLIVYMRPFLASAWAALADHARRTGDTTVESRGRTFGRGRGRNVRSPGSYVHVRRCRPGLEWIAAFLRGQRGSIVRHFEVNPATRRSELSIAVDASPWGIGGVLLEQGEIIAWFADEVSSADLRRFGAQRGLSKFNTHWELLAILTALRLWFTSQAHVRCEVQSDSMAAISAAIKLSSSSPGLNVMAREIALDLAEGTLEFGLFVHTPGVANIIPDALSRLHAPEPKPHPPVCAPALRSAVPPRNAGFWRASGAPCASRKESKAAGFALGRSGRRLVRSDSALRTFWRVRTPGRVLPAGRRFASLRLGRTTRYPGTRYPLHYRNLLCRARARVARERRTFLSPSRRARQDDPAAGAVP